MRQAALFRLAMVISLSVYFPPAVQAAGLSDRPGTGPKMVPIQEDADDAKGSGTAEPGFDNVEVIDPGLEGRLSVVSVGSDRTGTNLLSVFVTLKNLTSSSLMVEAETLYKDANGDWMDGGKAGWISLEIKPHEEFDYRSASLSDEAQDFLVRLRRPGSPADGSKS
jgi:hypothetical protein